MIKYTGQKLKGEEIMKKTKKKTVNKKPVIIGVSAGLIVVAVIAAAIVIPSLKVDADFEAVFEKMKAAQAPTVIITDMGAESNFSGIAGETTVTEAKSAEMLIGKLVAISEGFEYESRDRSVGTWDIRFRVSDGRDTADIYLSEGKMYYVTGETKFIFVPADEEVASNYKTFYSTVCAFVK